MIPKEKAKELVDKFRKLARISGGTGTSIEASKQCALICVDEILKSFILELYNELVEHINSLEFTSDDGFVNEEKIKYWEEVKQEINKL